MPGAAGRRLWLKYEKNHDFLSQDGIVAEAHWRLTSNPHLLRGIGAGSATQTVMLGPGRGVTTLADDPLLIYLCVHGAVHGWMRLKWLADVGALFAR